jgi:hypothetical protein
VAINEGHASSLDLFILVVAEALHMHSTLFFLTHSFI